MKFRLILDKSKDEEVVATVHGRTELTDKIEALVMAYEKTDRIVAYTEDDMRILKLSEIECITVVNGKTCAIDCNAEKYRLKQRLYELEEMLPSSFIRINKSSFANENRLKEFSAAFSGGVDAVFKCGYREYVSRRCFAAIKRRYE
ncbi:MAG: LytTR family transcriptional regulator [Clostridia bacterium]|nr:LytTR family transcriptional regulator [Clostridia bacterium]